MNADALLWPGLTAATLPRMATDSAPAPTPGFGMSVRVYYEDTDAGGLVYHARYLHYMERARTEWLRALGFEQDRLRAECGVLFAVRRADVSFLYPARFNDLLRVDARLTHAGRASLEFEQRVSRSEDGRACCRALVNIACIDAERNRPARIPEDIMTAILTETQDGR